MTTPDKGLEREFSKKYSNNGIIFPIKNFKKYKIILFKVLCCLFQFDLYAYSPYKNLTSRTQAFIHY
jgi:hypothetical protein